jgi:hypothetical protein
MDVPSENDFRLTFNLLLEDGDSKLYIHHLVVPQQLHASLGGLRARLVCHLLGDSFSCALMPRGDGEGYVMINKARMKKLNLRPGMELEVTFTPEKEPYGMPMPEVLQAILDTDPEASERFHQLTAGKQRNIIHYVASVKSPDLRIERGLKLLNNLKALPRGKETVREIILGPEL